jgi:hypothetical protein
MSLFSIKSRSDSSQHPPYSNQNTKGKDQEEIIGPLPDKGVSAEVFISNSLKAKIKKGQLFRKKAEMGFTLLEMAENGIKNIKTVIETEKDFNVVKRNIEEICENTIFLGKKILKNKEGHQEFLKYFPDFEINAPGDCKFAPNLSPECLNLADGLKNALEYLEKQENLIREKKEAVINELSKNKVSLEFSTTLENAKENITKNKDLGIKLQTDFFTQDLLKVI